MSYDVVTDGDRVLYARFQYADAVAQVNWLRMCGIHGVAVVRHSRKTKAYARTCV